MSKKFFKLGWIVLAALLMVALIALPACTAPPAEQQEEEEEEEEISIPFKNPDTFIEMTIGDAECLDPAWGYDTASGQQTTLIYQTLVWWDGTSSDVVPVLCTDYELLPDGVTYRFTIREGVKFHDGGDLTPEDVEYSFERALVQDRSGGPVWMLDEELLGVYYSPDAGFAAIDAAIEVDGGDVVITLADPAWAIPFLQVACGPWCSIVDKEWCVANGEWDGTEETWMDFHDPEAGTSYLWDEANGTGPWELEYWDRGIETSLVRFDDYWGDPVDFERVITKKVEEWTTRKLAFLAGDCDLAYVPLTYIDEMEGIDDIQLIKDLPNLTFDAFFMTFDIDPTSDFIGSGLLDGEGIPLDFFSDIDVRKGMNYAFDWDVYIADGMSGEGEQRGSPVIDGLTFYNPNAKMYSKDFDKATEHFQAAWGGLLWDTGFKFTLLYNSGNIARKTACSILAENLYLINPLFQVSLQPADWGTVMVPNLVTQKMPMFQIGWMADYPDPDNFVFPFMHSAGTFSHFQAYNNPEVDALIEAGKLELDTAAREAIYLDLQDWYYDDAPGIALAQPFARKYFTKYISGFYYNPMNPVYPGPLWEMSKSES
ncbi:ABC transporter substrate-binding protein [Chloroflexota bacterium]